MAKCRVWWDPGVSAYRAQFPFKQQIVDFLKQFIPHSEREWNGDTKTWTFTESYLDGTVKFLQICFGNQEVATVTRTQYEAQQQPRSSVAVSKLNTNDMLLVDFMKLIPYEAARAAYRQAAILLHPDKGGDMEKMSKVNALWTKIQKEVYGQ